MQNNISTPVINFDYMPCIFTSEIEQFLKSMKLQSFIQYRKQGQTSGLQKKRPHRAQNCGENTCLSCDKIFISFPA